MPDKPPVVISMGDPAGIGPEIIVKAAALLKDDIPLYCIADPDLMADTAKALNLPVPECLPPSVTLTSAPLPGQPDSRNAAAIQAAISDGVSACLNGQASALVTAPIAKSVLYEAGFNFPGHTEYLAELTRSAAGDTRRGPVMMLMAADLRVALTSVHKPLKVAIASLDTDHIVEISQIVHMALKRDFAIEQPRLAMAGLNPHAGEGGALGSEEAEIIAPAVAALRDMGLNVSDPQSPDTLFHEEARQGYDAVICHYHDQGLIPVKTLDFHGGVNVTLGLPIVRTSPDHGTAFDLAGSGRARPDSMIAAIRAADRIARNRAS